MRRTAGAIAVSALSAIVLIGPAAPGYAGADRSHDARLSVTPVSNPRPALVSGGDVLVRVSGSGGTPKLAVDGHPSATVAHAQPDGSWLALVTGMAGGRHRITATRGRQRADLTVDNHSVNGPVFSGSQQLPYICQTPSFGLPPADPPACAVPTQVSYLYKTTAGSFVPLADPASRPADLASAQVNGHAVPYVVRLEQGTIDRAVYQIAALYDGTAPVPWSPDQSWNRRLVYTFGGGCDGGFHQGTSTGGVVNDLFLAQGYAVASSTLNVLDTNCSTIISAEAAMMVKEHFIEVYGPVAHTIGWGGSGGAIQQYDIADQYPGILDGIVPGVSFTDPFTTTGPVADCRLLDRYFAAGGAGFTPAQRQAVSGFRSYDSCVSWDATFASRITATDSCDSSIPVALRWNPVTNPSGVKCSAAEQLVNQLGRDPRTGFARSPVDNVGVQYGLQALRDGQISAQQFADLNAGIGGFDYTGKPVPQRSSADPKALAASYRDDVVNSGGLGLASTPVIDQRIDLDLAGFGNDIHTTEWSYVMRARMTAAGTAANQVIIENSVATAAAASVYELAAMDRWLSAIDADRSGRPLPAKVRTDRPADISDGCFRDDGTLVRERLSYGGSGQCASLFPVGSNTRLVAGEPLAMPVLSCALRPLDFAGYPVAFTAAQKAELRSAFPTGVCDYGRRGPQQRRPAGVWLSYSR
ncbi:DUF6351 family protein [Rugosimonospora africana]|uniref:DUF6351 domain-containing protein n=1 Tax=Rugosimonospora africana TaxID=556532 RepID=A0A8J3VR15_9ACTN|nr:DUF6351 family protein [Rugosimonospora africana]GIH15700.1 hypothetical protein Raf01_38720 [Rugosimonospora africana]